MHIVECSVYYDLIQIGRLHVILDKSVEADIQYRL